MDARLCCAAALAALVSMGAGYRTQNFVVMASPDSWARKVAEQAEEYRRDLALEWLGHELRPWPEPCPIRVEDAPGRPAGGETSFTFIGDFPRHWTMRVQGTRERILDSVLPHEVTHTVFATHFGQPLPRWADEGACTTVEHEAERDKQFRLLRTFLRTGRGIPFNRMFAMKQYPRDILPLYSQGYSLARYLIQRGGKRKFVEYIGEGMRTDQWPAATRKHYGFKDLSELQLTWNQWVAKGSPRQSPTQDGGELVASRGSANRGGRGPRVLLQSPDPPTAAPASGPSPNALASTRLPSSGPPLNAPLVAPGKGPRVAAPRAPASRPISTGENWYVAEARRFSKDETRQRPPQSAEQEETVQPPSVRSADSRTMFEWGQNQRR